MPAINSLGIEWGGRLIFPKEMAKTLSPESFSDTPARLVDVSQEQQILVHELNPDHLPNELQKIKGKRINYADAAGRICKSTLGAPESVQIIGPYGPTIISSESATHLKNERIFSATSSDDAGFWPVIRLPSTRA